MENLENIKQGCSKNSSPITIYIKDSLILFLKVYGLRIIYSFIKNYKFLQKKFTFGEVLNTIFNIANLRTSLSISLLPLLFKIFRLGLKNILSLNKNSDLIVFLSALISALISINIEEKTKLVEYIILSIGVRVFHTLIIIFLKKNNLFQKTGKVWDYFVFLLSAILVWSVYFLNPGYAPLTNLIDSYANYRNEAEKMEVVMMRNSTRIV
jgi:hypothetical protein